MLVILIGQAVCSKDDERVVASVDCSGKLVVVESEHHVLLLLS